MRQATTELPPEQAALQEKLDSLTKEKDDAAVESPSGDVEVEPVVDSEVDESSEALADTEEAQPTENADDTATEDAPPAEAGMLSPAMAVKAARAGLQDEDIYSCQSDAELERAISLATRLGGGKKEKDSGPQRAEEEVDVDALIPDMDPEQYADPAPIKALGAIKTVLKQVLNENRQFRQERSVQRGLEEGRWFEGQLGSLTKDAETLFGKGAFEDVRDDKKAMQERNALFTTYAKLKGDRRHDKQALQRAYNAVYGGRIAQQATSDVAARLKKNSSQLVSAPTQRHGSQPTGDARAMSMVGKKLAELKRKRGG